MSQIKVDVVDWWGHDRDLAHQAWASTYDLDKHETRTEEQVRRMVTDIVQKAHGTPKERVWVDFAITCPIAVERQFDKYRMTVQYQDFQVEFLEAPMGRLNLTQNELSGRYRTIPNRPFAMPDDVAEIMSRAVGADYDAKSDFAKELEAQHQWYEIQLAALKRAEKEGRITNAEYKRSREVCRMVLGTGFLTDFRLLGNLHAVEWILEQRGAADAQPESQEVARAMFRAMKEKNVAPTFLEETAQRLAAKGISLV